MEAEATAQTYIDQGRELLARGQAQQSAQAYAQAVQLDPTLIAGHLGLAESNLALGAYGIVHMACRKVLELQPAGPDSALARAILALLDRRYDRALAELDAVVAADPGRAYAHAMRAYCLHQLGRDYEAALADAKAHRLAYGVNFAALFPPVDAGTVPYQQTRTLSEDIPAPPPAYTRRPPAPMRRPAGWWRRRFIRARFAFSQFTAPVTTFLIAVNVAIYLVMGVLSRNFLSINPDVLIQYGAQVNLLISEGQYWRLFTTMFLHLSIMHIGLNMLSLYFVGRPVERIYGSGKYILLYLVSGLVGSLAVFFFAGPVSAAVGASGAIFGIFGAFGSYFWLNRHSYGPAGRAILSQWFFWLVLNLVFDFTFPDISYQAHIGGLITGLILGALLAGNHFRLWPRRRS
jgi:membrane associated rhomboid family serine protease